MKHEKKKGIEISSKSTLVVDWMVTCVNGNYRLVTAEGSRWMSVSELLSYLNKQLMRPSETKPIGKKEAQELIKAWEAYFGPVAGKETK